MNRKIKGLLPWAALVLTALGLFGNDRPLWVQYSAIGVAFLIGIGWVVSEGSWLGRAIKYKLFPISKSF